MDAKKRVEIAGGSSSAIRKTPVRTPVTQPRTKPSPSVPQKTQVGSSGSTGTAAVKLRRNILPVSKVNPTDLKIKGGSGVAGSATDPLKPMHPDSANRTFRAEPLLPNTCDQEDEALDVLYTRYLQNRLLAQAAAEKRRIQYEENAKRLTDICVKHVLRQTHLEPQVRSVKRTSKEVIELDKLESLEEIIIPFMRKLCEQSAEATFEQISTKLSNVLDALTIRNGMVPPKFSSANRMTSVSEQVEHVSTDSKSSLNFVEGITGTRADLQAVAIASAMDEKELNERMIKLLSLTLGQAALKRQMNVGRG